VVAHESAHAALASNRSSIRSSFRRRAVIGQRWYTEFVIFQSPRYKAGTEVKDVKVKDMEAGKVEAWR